jgi:ankyrin repeat protein
MAKILVYAGCPVDGRDDWGRTALHLAAEEGDAAMIKVFLSLGADKHVQDTSGSTPLALAQHNGHAKVFRLLDGK